MLHFYSQPWHSSSNFYPIVRCILLCKVHKLQQFAVHNYPKWNQRISRFVNNDHGIPTPYTSDRLVLEAFCYSSFHIHLHRPFYKTPCQLKPNRVKVFNVKVWCCILIFSSILLYIRIVKYTDWNQIYIHSYSVLGCP